ncbi:MAG TPA: hydrogenase maturation nickel metallochaperone HypA [Acidobacteriota bacterium]|nr:hydrogenase maturation nickel metallochaperone HypA [Acidobacteriota bacterium]
MHEVGIARDILKVVNQQVPADVAHAVKSIRVKVGALARVTPEALRFGFQIASVSTPFQSAQLLVDQVPLQMECEVCLLITVGSEALPICAACGSTRLKILSGNEMEVVEVQYE